ncbi:MAG: glutathione S-transferase N-terminal domain-containing protein [Pseudomonadota bacterium]
MDLIVSVTSPYARKARIVRLEKGLQDRVRVIEASPLAEGSQAIIRNPLGKVPSLILSDDRVLFDSPVICAYLDALDGAPTLTGQTGKARWACEHAQALGDGIMDAAFSTVMERRRPKPEQSDFWLARWQASLDGGLDAMDRDIEARGDIFDVGAIACAVALGYLDFRLPETAWRTGRSALQDWYAKQIARPSFIETDYD